MEQRCVCVCVCVCESVCVCVCVYVCGSADIVGTSHISVCEAGVERGRGKAEWQGSVTNIPRRLSPSQCVVLFLHAGRSTIQTCVCVCVTVCAYEDVTKQEHQQCFKSVLSPPPRRREVVVVAVTPWPRDGHAAPSHCQVGALRAVPAALHLW